MSLRSTKRPVGPVLWEENRTPIIPFNLKELTAKALLLET